MEPGTFIDFDSLPYPLSESDYEVISMYKELAVKREKEISKRRQQRNDDLLSYVTNRLKEWGMRKEVPVTEQQTNTIATHHSHSTQSPLVSNHTHSSSHSTYTQSPLVLDHTHSSSLHSTQLPLVSQHNDHAQQGPPLKSVSCIPVRSPPKPIMTSTKRGSDAPYHHHHHHHETVVPRHLSVFPTLARHSARSVQVSRPSHFVHQSRSQFVPPTDSRSRLNDPLCVVSAVVKGYLTRRLLTSEKIQDIVTTIKDAELVLQSLDSPGTMQEFDLQQRIINQLHTAKLKFHHIFFDLLPKDKMAYITHSRNLRREKQLKRLELQQMKRNRLSTATLKSIERKKKQSSQTPTTAAQTALSKTRKPGQPSSKPGSNKNTSLTGIIARSETKRKNKMEEAKQKGVSLEKKTVRPHPFNTTASQSSPNGSKKSDSSKTPQSTGQDRRTVPSKIPPPSSGKFQNKRSYTTKHK